MAEAHSHTTLGDYLVREGIITQSQFNLALSEQRSSSRSIGRILVDSGLITESMRMSILEKRFGYKTIPLKDVQVDPMILAFIPYSFAEKHHVVPVRQEDHALVVAMEDPSDLMIIDAIKNQVGMAVRACMASQEDIQVILNQYATGVEEAAKAKAARRTSGHSWLYRMLKVGAFPVLALVPLVGFFVALAIDDDFQRAVMDYIKQNNLGWYDLAIYIGLIWGLWTIILFEINGLIFGSKPREEASEEF